MCHCVALGWWQAVKAMYAAEPGESHQTSQHRADWLEGVGRHGNDSKNTDDDGNDNDDDDDDYNNNNDDDDDDTNRVERHNSRFVQSPHSAANCLQHGPSSDQGVTVCKSLK